MEHNNTEHAHHEHIHTSKKAPTISLPAAIITGAAIIGLGLMIGLHRSAPQTAQQQQAPAADTGSPTSVPTEVAKIRTNDYIRGDKNADILLIEYSDSDCPFCQRFHPTLEQLVNDSKGSIAWVYRYFPLDIHPNSYTESTALECVGELGGNDKFWQYLDTVINVTLNPDTKSNQALITFANQEGISSDALKACVTGKSATGRIDADIAEAKNIGVRGTPFTIAVNQKTGKQVIIPGAYPIDSVKQMIDSIK